MGSALGRRVVAMLQLTTSPARGSRSHIYRYSRTQTGQTGLPQPHHSTAHDNLYSSKPVIFVTQDTFMSWTHLVTILRPSSWTSLLPQDRLWCLITFPNSEVMANSCLLGELILLPCSWPSCPIFLLFWNFSSRPCHFHHPNYLISWTLYAFTNISSCSVEGYYDGVIFHR